MADEITQPVAPVVPVSEPVVSTPAPVETPSVPVETVKPEVTSVESTVLGGDEAPKIETPVEVKPEVKTETQPEVKTESKVDVKPEAKPVEGDKPIEVKAEEKPAEPIKFEWKFPENVTVDQERIGQFNKEFGDFLTANKLDTKLGKEFGQKLLDRHVSEMQSVAEKIAAAYDKVWKDQTKNWYEEFVKDPEIGGNKRDTTVNAARDFIRRHGGTPEQQTAIRTLMKTTGVGNHPALIRLFANANLAMAEPKTVKAETPVPQAKESLKTRMYGKKKS